MHVGYEVARLKRQGRSMRSIAESLGINRRTVGRLLREQQRRRDEGETVLVRELAAERVPKGSLIDEHDATIRGWLDDYPDLTAERCLAKLRELKFPGGRTMVQDHLRAIRAERAPIEVAEVVSHPPGQRGEFDWSPYKLGREKDVKVSVWNAQLCWSRFPTPQARDNQRKTTILDCLRMSLTQWGGVPREILTDTMKGVVDRWECNQPILNARFVDLAAHYDFTVRIAARRCPKHKARCERRFWFIERNALNGRTFESVSALDDFFEVWVRDEVLARRHPDRPETIAQVLAEERLHLRPLPTYAYDTRDVVMPVVTATGHAIFQTNQYPVPGARPGDLVYICADAARLVVCSASAQRLVEHERLPDGAKIQLPQLPGMRRSRLDVEELLDQLAEWHDDARAFGQDVRQRGRNAGSQVARLLMLQGQWSREDILAAMRHAAGYGCFDVAAVERILQAEHTPRSLPEAIAERSRDQIRQVMKDHPVPPRTLDGYACLHHGDRSLARKLEPSTDPDEMGSDLEDSDE